MTLAMVFLQVIMWMFFTFSQLVMVVFLPALILCLPIRINGFWAMVIAFLVACTVDFVCGAPLGLTAVALVPIAYFRTNLIRLVFGAEVISLKENLSFRRYGLGKFTLSSFIILAIFLALYIIVDSAGTRPLWIDIQKFIYSLLISLPFTVYASKILCSDYYSRR